MATLRVYISRLRRVLGPGTGILETQAPGYRLNVAADQLDASRFECLVQAADTAMSAHQPERAAASLREALDLWHGPALLDVAEFAFAQADASRLEEARLSALESRVEADLACGRHASLIGELDTLTASHPLRELLTGQRMLALYRCGRQADALSAYTGLRVRLAEELGIDPSPDLRRMQDTILRQDPALDWHRGEVSGAPARAAGGGAEPRAGAGPEAIQPGFLPAPRLPTEATSFVGREAELNTIAELLGLSRLVTLTGPGGSGKSRLALRAAAQAAGDFSDGVRLVELASVVRSGLVVPAVALALSAREEPGRPLLDSVISGLQRERGPADHR